MDQFSHNLASASLQEVEGPLKALLKAFPMADREDMRGLIGTYVIAIDGYSLAAIQKSVTRFIRGEVEGHDPRFAPTPAQFSRDVRYRQDLMTPPEPPRQALPAPIRQEPTPEERQRVADRVRGWVKDRTPPPLGGLKPREPGDIVRQMRSENIRLSPEALAGFTGAHLNTVAVSDPAEQYEAWNKAQVDLPTPLLQQKEGKAA